MASRVISRHLKSVVLGGNFSFSQRITLQKKLLKKSGLLCSSRLAFSTSSVFQNSDANVTFHNGLPIITVPLPSRKESCQFPLKPVTNTLGDFLQYIQDEDHGVDRVAAYNADGMRIAKSTPIGILLQKEFDLLINDERYTIPQIETGLYDREHTEQLSDVKNTIAQLYSALNVEQYQLEKQRELEAKVEEIQTKLQPYEDLHLDLAAKAKRRVNALTWLGLGGMSIQFGILARLTWWEYSWDIMEPITYFVTYGTAMAMYSYYVLTRQEFTFPAVQDREFLLTLHKHAKKNNLDINEFNRLKEALFQAKEDLSRLKDPLQLNLPIEHLKKQKYIE